MKIKYTISIILLCLVSCLSVFSQEKNSNKKTNFNIEKFKQEKAQFIINEAKLTPEEAKKFLPLVDELFEKRFNLNRAYKGNAKQIRQKKDKTNEDYDKLIEQSFELASKELELNKKYLKKFRGILSAEKIYKYQRAEHRFMKQLFRKRRKEAKQ